MTLAERARIAWLVWGDGWALHTRCDGCGEIHYCRGPERDRMLCLECFDLGVKPKRKSVPITE